MKLRNKYIIKRLGEPSTWRGIVAILTAAGVGLSPDQQAAIITFGMAAIGAIGIFTKDKKED